MERFYHAVFSFHHAVLSAHHAVERKNHVGQEFCGLLLAVQKLLHHIDVVSAHGPLMLFASVLLVLGMNLLAIGLLGEMQVRHYHSPLRRAPYSVECILRTESEESAIPE